MEHMLLATFPPLETAERDGVIVGSSLGATGRANSAVVLDDIRDLDATITWANDWLATRERTPLFRLSPLAPDALAERLGRDNAYNTTSCLHLDLAAIATPAQDGRSVEITAERPADWISERDEAGQAEVTALMCSVDGDLAWALIRDRHGMAVAAGRGVLVEHWLCVQAMYTLPAARGQGHATTVLQTLHTWAVERGATNAFLNVLATNDTAKSIYGAQGYRHVYDYTYVGSADATRSC